MNLSEQMDFINKIEADFPVESWTIDGIHIWPLVRTSLGTHLAYTEIGKSIDNTQGYLPNKIAKLINLMKGHADYIRAYVSDFSNNARINQKVDAVFLGDQVSRIYFNESWYDRFCDPFIGEFKLNGKNCLHMEPLHRYLTPRYAPGVFIQPHLDYLTIKSILAFNVVNHLEIKLQDFELFQRMMEINNIDFHLSSNQLVQYTYRLRLYADFFKKILHRVSPQIGFVVCYYGLEGMAFNLACREMGIPSVDIQHGVQGDLHRAYGRWNKLPKAGYELLPTIFWVWSEVEAKAINNWNEKVKKWHRPFIGGNPWLNLWWNNDNNICMYYKNQINNISGFLESSIKILLTLQPGVPNHGIPEWLINAIDRSPSDWFWLIRVHPCMLAERGNVKKLIATCSHKKVNVDDATDLPLPSILKSVDIHVTHSSSTVIEAQQYGVPTIAVSNMGKELYLEQFELGWLEVAYDGVSLLAMINKQHKRKSELVYPFAITDTAARIKNLMNYV
jgi:hypothetical protein